MEDLTLLAPLGARILASSVRTRYSNASIQNTPVCIRPQAYTDCPTAFERIYSIAFYSFLQQEHEAEHCRWGAPNSASRESFRLWAILLSRIFGYAVNPGKAVKRRTGL